MPVASERVVVLMPRAEKARLEAKARRAGASVGEIVRRSVSAYDPEDDDASISRLLDVFAESHGRTLKALEAAEKELAATRAYFARKGKSK